MKEDDKQLLLQYLCARLPYGVVCKPDVKSPIIAYSTLESINRDINGGFFANTKDRGIDGNELASTACNIEYVVPYLRPMSSMTEEEREELSNYENTIQRADFFYSHHLDPRNLIEKGLALEAPEGMYEK